MLVKCAENTPLNWTSKFDCKKKKIGFVSRAHILNVYTGVQRQEKRSQRYKDVLHYQRINERTNGRTDGRMNAKKKMLIQLRKFRSI